jgi:hypothetical protein
MNAVEQMGVTEELAGFVTSAGIAKASADVRHLAKRSIIDGIWRDRCRKRRASRTNTCILSASWASAAAP